MTRPGSQRAPHPARTVSGSLKPRINHLIFKKSGERKDTFKISVVIVAKSERARIQASDPPGLDRGFVTLARLFNLIETLFPYL